MPPTAPRAGAVLRIRFVLLVIALLLATGVTVAFWTQTYLPATWKSFDAGVGNSWMDWLAGGTAALLVVIPLAWIWVHRVVDLLALALSQQALIFCSYYYIEETAAHIKEATLGILQTAALLVFLNAVGFIVLLIAIFFSYQAASLGKSRLPALPRPQEVLDRRMIFLLRIAGVLVALCLIAPIAATGAVPLFQGQEARIALEESSPGRAFYNFGTTLLPFLIGGLSVAILRRPRRLFGWDGIIIAVVVCIQLLTTNRLPLAISLMTTVSLLSMERRWPRWILVGAFAAYVGAFTALSGFTALIRTDPGSLTSGNVFSKSVSEAFMGDNIIDLRDGAWVLSCWNFEPLLGTTYLGGLASMVPSGIFPQKKQWHLGLTALRIVGWSDENHFGLRVSFFGESFLNFGMAGVVLLGIVLGSLFGFGLRLIHVAAESPVPCLWRNLSLVLFLQMLMPLSNTSDAFYSWSLLGVAAVIWATVVFPPTHLLKAHFGARTGVRR